MKVLIVHNFHRIGSSSGDDMVVNNEAKILEDYGHNVLFYSKDNSEFDKKNHINRVWIGGQIPWSLKNYFEIKKIIIGMNPDIVHIHNFFPFITSSVYEAINEMKKPIVQSLHDFRFFCPKAFLFNGSGICEECVNYGLHKSVVHKCFQNSFIKTAIAAGTVYLTRKFDVLDKITTFITFTEFGRRKFTQLGIPEEKIFVKHHFMFDSNSLIDKNDDDSKKYFLFLGRLGEEKGIKFLINSWKKLPSIPLTIAGSGPLERWVKDRIRNNTDIEYIGFIQHSDILKILKRTYAIILPSMWYETFGLVIMEAYAAGIPAIVSDIGAIADIVKDGKTGLLFEAGNKEDLAKKVRCIREHADVRNRMGKNARKEFEEKYTPERNYKMLMDIYEKTIGMYRKR
jgi:glycosyltransferase involved in cell wall biosynthesis